MEMVDRQAVWHNLQQDTKGVAFLEFTILFPLLLTLTLGVFEFGHAMKNRHTIDKAVRDAARYLARVPATCTSAGTANGTIDSG
jgi:Flp pilus assembly protein TadG